MHKKYSELEDLKNHTDFLLKQLVEGSFVSTEVYFNNICHLLSLYQSLDSFFEDESFRRFISINNKDVLFELHTTGKVIMALLNFCRVIQKEGMTSHLKNSNEL